MILFVLTVLLYFFETFNRPGVSLASFGCSRRVDAAPGNVYCIMYVQIEALHIHFLLQFVRDLISMMLFVQAEPFQQERFCKSCFVLLVNQ